MKKNIKNDKKNLRMCVGCNLLYNKDILLRIVKSPNGEIRVVENNKKYYPGRSTYICFKESCYKIIRKKRRMTKFLKSDIPENIWQKIEIIIKKVERATLRELRKEG